MANIHAGDWHQVSGKPECFRQKTCPDCHKTVTKSQHEYSKWRKVNYSTCDSVRECIHCNHVEQDIVHSYEIAGKDSNCRIIHRCSNCGHEKLGETDHEWLTIFSRELKVHGKRKCKRCGTQG